MTGTTTTSTTTTTKGIRDTCPLVVRVQLDDKLRVDGRYKKIGTQFFRPRYKKVGTNYLDTYVIQFHQKNDFSIGQWEIVSFYGEVLVRYTSKSFQPLCPPMYGYELYRDKKWIKNIKITVQGEILD